MSESGGKGDGWTPGQEMNSRNRLGVLGNLTDEDTMATRANAVVGG